MIKGTVYLAGRIEGIKLRDAALWRRNVSKRLIKMGLETIDPMRDIACMNLQGEMELLADLPENYIFERDIRDLDRANYMIVKLDDYGSFVGTLCEIGYFYNQNKPIYGWRDNYYSPITHPFIQGMVTQFLDFDDLAEHLEKVTQGW